VTNIYETGVLSTVAQWPRNVWRKEINDFRTEMTGRTSLGGKRRMKQIQKRALIELKGMAVRHFLNKWNLTCNKVKLGATTDGM